MLFDLRYNGCNYADQTNCGDRWFKNLIRVKHRISWKTPGQSVEPAMRDVCINQPLQPLPPRHQWVTWVCPKRTMLSNLRMPLEDHHWTQTCIFSAVTKSRNVIYLGKEPILTRIIAGQWLPHFLIFTASIWPYSGQIICFFFMQEILELWSCRQWVPRVLSPWNGEFLYKIYFIQNFLLFIPTFYTRSWSFTSMQTLVTNDIEPRYDVIQFSAVHNEIRRCLRLWLQRTLWGPARLWWLRRKLWISSSRNIWMINIWID